MSYFAFRTCTEIPEGRSLSDNPPPLPLVKFRESGSYVLIGPPGAGKTKSFKKEAKKDEGGHYVTARDFINLPNQPEWREAKKLFIDGLDEMRAGAGDQRTPFDEIRAKLQGLGCPQFRLSCREADWLGTNDRNHLKNISPDRKLKVLRLDPLSQEEILRILRYNHNTKDPEQFIASAREKGIYVLLENPQSLKMLASVVADGRWPETRMGIFDLACRKLLEEHNQEHEFAKPDCNDIPDLLNKAGRLCAVQLLTGHAGYSLTQNETDCEYISPKKIDGGDQEVFRHVLGSKLFESPIEARISPVHRQVVEFLGGQYLAKLIGEGLPVKRTLSLMTGYDGGIPSELRGLSAWLAAHSPQSRREIIERDPIGVILYGDIKSFSTSEKRQVLTRLAEETRKNPRFIGADGFGSHLEYLPTPDMKEYFKQALTGPAGDPAQQSFAIFLLETLRYRPSIPELADGLMEVTRDENRWTAIRSHALLAFIQQRKIEQQTTTELETLLEDINTGAVADPDDDLLGILLKELYPDSLSASSVWQYFRTPKKPGLAGYYFFFWMMDIEKQSTGAQYAELFSEFFKHFDQFLKKYKADKKKFYLFPQLCSLFYPRLDPVAGKISPYWVASGRELQDLYKKEEIIGCWLSKDSETRMVISTGLERQQPAAIDYVKSHEEALRENRCPPHLIHDLARVYFGGNADFPGDEPVYLLRDLLGWDESLVETVLRAFRESVVRTDVPCEAEIIRLRRDDKAHYLALPFLAGVEELFQNNPESGEVPITEKQMRQALAFYYNAPLPASFSDSQPLWYQKLLTSNPDIVSDVLISSARFRMPKREEAVSDLYELAFRGNYAEVASLATLPLLEAFPVRCSKRQMQGLGYLLRAALLRCDEGSVLSLIRRKLSYRNMNIAQRVCWLTSGLIVSPSGFIEELEKYLTGNERRVKNLLEFIKKFPDELIERLDVPALELLIRLTGYFTVFAWRPYEDELELAAKIGAPYRHGSSDSEKSNWVDLPPEAINPVQRLIKQLADIPSPSATEAFEKLLSDDGLRSWRQYLPESLRKQKSARREAGFRYHDINQVIQTMNNRKPANAADLSALAIDILTDISKEIRDGNTSDWHQYWDMGEREKPLKPRTENLCRDALLSDLRIKLSTLGINVQPEGRYADERRSDIRISCNGYNVPVEIKKSSHRDLWSAIKNQLIGKYTRDPGTDGYGIYLVFWFGKEPCPCQMPKSGTRPQNARELQKRLTHSLTADEQRKISVRVIDVVKS